MAGRPLTHLIGQLNLAAAPLGTPVVAEESRCFPSFRYRHRPGVPLSQLSPLNMTSESPSSSVAHPVGAIRIRSRWSIARLRIASTWPLCGGNLSRFANVEGVSRSKCAYWLARRRGKALFHEHVYRSKLIPAAPDFQCARTGNHRVFSRRNAIS